MICFVILLIQMIYLFLEKDCEKYKQYSTDIQTTQGMIEKPAGELKKNKIVERKEQSFMSDYSVQYRILLKRKVWINQPKKNTQKKTTKKKRDGGGGIEL